MSFDWRPALIHGATLAINNHRDLGDEVETWQAMWALLCEAAEVSRAFPGPPRSGHPEKAAWPDAPDEITHWQRQAAYLRGDLDELPYDDPAPPVPSAAEVTRADVVLDAWHTYALRRGAFPYPHKKYIYRLASGAPMGAVCRMCGQPVHYVADLRRKASLQMLRGIGVE